MTEVEGLERFVGRSRFTANARRLQSGGAQPLDLGGDVVDDEVDAVPAAWLGLASVRNGR